MKKPTNYKPLPEEFREFVDRVGAEEVLQIYIRFEAAAKRRGFNSIAKRTLGYQHQICDAYGWPYPTDLIH